jgi:hypothetical protein
MSWIRNTGADIDFSKVPAFSNFPAVFGAFVVAGVPTDAGVATVAGVPALLTLSDYSLNKFAFRMYKVKSKPHLMNLYSV